MNKLKLIWALSLAVAILTVGCKGLPLMENPLAAVPAGMDLQTVRKSIEEGAARHDWELTEDGENAFIAVQGKSSLNARVRIEYTRSRFSISYLSSSGFKTGDQNRIHPKYNAWVETLKADILKRLEVNSRH